MAHTIAWTVGRAHGENDAENGRCLKVLQMLRIKDDDEYARGYRQGIVNFIKYVNQNWN